MRIAKLIVLYGIKNCDTMRKARTWLDSHGIAYRFHDYKQDGVEPKNLEHWCQSVGWERLLNRNGTTFRKLDERQKSDLNERKAISLMAEHPSLIKRPVLELGAHLLVGFNSDEYSKILVRS